MAVIEIQQAEKEYRLGETVVPALREVDLTIDKGKFIAVWGPSGSGKSTLLNLIGAIDTPTRGKVLINGVDITTTNDDRRAELRNAVIGYVFQKFNLIAVLTALENVMLPLQIRGATSAEARKEALDRLDEVGLLNVIKHRPDTLSGGQQQRVAIARALVTKPSIIIADEPTANLDSENSRKIIALMRQINRSQKTTFIFSTHDQRLLESVDELLRLEDGKLINGKGCHA